MNCEMFSEEESEDDVVEEDVFKGVFEDDAVEEVISK